MKITSQKELRHSRILDQDKLNCSQLVITFNKTHYNIINKTTQYLSVSATMSYSGISNTCWHRLCTCQVQIDNRVSCTELNLYFIHLILMIQIIQGFSQKGNILVSSSPLIHMAKGSYLLYLYDRITPNIFNFRNENVSVVFWICMVKLS